jgi:hypothetical protein
MAAHENRVSVRERLGQRTTERRVSNQHVRHSERVANLEDRDSLHEKRGRLEDRAERHVGYAEGDERRGMVVADGSDVGTQLIDLSVDEPLEIHRTFSGFEWIAVEAVFHDVVGVDELRSP